MVTSTLIRKLSTAVLAAGIALTFVGAVAVVHGGSATAASSVGGWAREVTRSYVTRSWDEYVQLQHPELSADERTDLAHGLAEQYRTNQSPAARSDGRYEVTSVIDVGRQWQVDVTVSFPDCTSDLYRWWIVREGGRYVVVDRDKNPAHVYG